MIEKWIAVTLYQLAIRGYSPSRLHHTRFKINLLFLEVTVKSAVTVGGMPQSMDSTEALEQKRQID